MALAFPALWLHSVHAAGLGELQMQSALGQSLNARVILLADAQEDVLASCFKARLELPDGGFLMPLNLSVSTAGSTKILNLSSRQTVQEPAIKLILESSCGSLIRKEYLQLLDPPNSVGREKELVQAQSVVAAPAAEKTSADSLATKKTEHKRVAEKSTAVLVPLKSKTKTVTAPAHDVLKLTDETVLLDQGLKISHELSESPNTPVGDDIRFAQQKMMAYLRGEDQGRTAQTQVKVDEAKIQSLQNEANQLRKQNQQDRAALEEIRDNSYSRNWVIGLLGFVLLGFAALSYLFFRMYRMTQRKEFSWWEQKNEKAEPERKKNIEEIVNSVQASYGPTTGQQMFSMGDDPDAGEVETAGHHLDFEPVATSATPVKIQHSHTPIRPAKVELPSLEDTNSSTFNFFPNRGNSLKVDEISDVTQEAEFWMSVNDPDRAIAILEPQSLDENPESPVPWLYLLDLYRATGKKQKYEELRDRFIVFFNANIPEFDAGPGPENVRHLEDFAHLMEKICNLWNTNEILPFLESLLVDDRGGKRLGFDLPVYRDILLLIAIANELERAKAFGLVPDSGWTTV